MAKIDSQLIRVALPFVTADTAATCVLLCDACTRVYRDRTLTIRQMDARVRRLRRAIVYLVTEPLHPER